MKHYNALNGIHEKLDELEIVMDKLINKLTAAGMSPEKMSEGKAIIVSMRKSLARKLHRLSAQE